MAEFANPRKEKLMIGSDPNGLTWSRDKSKYGYKMLVAMGWQEGKGLGTKGNGITEHIRVKKKIDNSGIGLEAADKAKMDVSAKTVVFHSVLKKLTPIFNNDDDDIQNEKKKVKKLKKKIVKEHMYKKKIEAKTLKNKKKEDVAAILGMTQTTLNTVEKDEFVKNSEKTKSNSLILKRSKMTTADYFAMRMKEIAKKRKISSDNSNPKSKKKKKTDSESDSSLND